MTEVSSDSIKPQETSRRLRMSLSAGLGFLFENPSEIPVVGKELLKEIPPNRKVIIATTHLCDSDVPIAGLALSDSFDIAIVHHSTHDNLLEDPVSWVGAAIAGRKNFLSVNSRKQDGKVVTNFVPEDFEPMEDALDKGKTIVIAAHNPTYGWKLPQKGGLGAAYLAQLSDALILPVSINVESASKTGTLADMKKVVSTSKKKFSAQVSVGHPIDLKKIEVERIAEILKKRKEGNVLSPEEKKEFSEIHTKLQEQAEVVMSSLAAMLPPEKRGVWGDNGR